MSDKPVPKIKKAHFLKAMEELEQLDAEISERKARQDTLRHKMADAFFPGDPASAKGTRTVKIHGYEVKVERKLNISINKEAEEQLASDDEDLYNEVMPEKVVRKLDATLAAKKLDALADYATTKQGLPVVKFKRIES